LSPGLIVELLGNGVVVGGALARMALGFDGAIPLNRTSISGAHSVTSALARSTSASISQGRKTVTHDYGAFWFGGIFLPQKRRRIADRRTFRRLDVPDGGPPCGSRLRVAVFKTRLRMQLSTTLGRLVISPTSLSLTSCRSFASSFKVRSFTRLRNFNLLLRSL
jgi:hypothetical protein